MDFIFDVVECNMINVCSFYLFIFLFILSGIVLNYNCFGEKENCGEYDINSWIRSVNSYVVLIFFCMIGDIFLIIGFYV